MARIGFELRGVTRQRQGRRILDDIDLDLPAEGITVIVGRSGSGKTSLLRLLNRLDVPDTGTIRWRGDDLTSLEPCAHRRRVGYIAQRPIPFDGTAVDNLRVADPELTDVRAQELLALVGIGALADQDAKTLSGGEAQRLCIARALVNEPELILADEPTSALDAEARDDIEDLALALAADGLAWIWVSHDGAQTRTLADSVVVMEQGRVRAHDNVEAIAADRDELVRRAMED